MSPLSILFLGAACGFLTGNPKARAETFKQVQKMFGMAIDGLNKQGGNYVPKADEAVERPEEPKE